MSKFFETWKSFKDDVKVEKPGKLLKEFTRQDKQELLSQGDNFTISYEIEMISKQKIDNEIDKEYRKIDISKAYDMRFNRGLSFYDIANHFRCSAQAVQQRLQKFSAILKDKPEIDEFENRKADLLSSVEFQLLHKLVDPDTIQKATLNNAAYAYTQVFSANRLTRGKSTENINVHSLSMSLDQLQSRELELRKKLSDIQPVVHDTSEQQQTTTDSIPTP